MTHKNSTTQSGFTLLELLLVIGVAALLLIGGIATYRLVSDGNKATETTRLLLTVRQQAQVLSQQEGGDYSSVAFDSTAPAPTSVLVTSGTLRDQQKNPFGGDITIGANTDPSLLDVEFTGISQSACIKLGLAINNANEITNLLINTTNIAAFPTTAAIVSAACTTGVNAITWTLK
jgi:prepilin-type N-terminal cleavage/methylation domain-containing protein